MSTPGFATVSCFPEGLARGARRMFMVLNRKDPKLTSEAGMRAMLRAVDDDENISQESE